MYAGARLLSRRRDRRRLALALLFGDPELGVPALQPWRKDVDVKLDMHSTQLTAILAEHRSNGGSSSWDGMVAIDKNLRALAASLEVTLPDHTPLGLRHKPATPVPAPQTHQEDPS